MNEDDARLKIFPIPARLILELLNGLKDGQIFEIIDYGIPKGAKMVGVWCDYSYGEQVLLVKMQHESFDVVPPMCTVPHGPPLIECQVRRVARLTELQQ